jgi:ubiquinone/menaquinone biosynthesis C-methylase UbiE
VSNAILRRQPKKILDIGCGAGVNLPLANQYRDIKYYGVDYAEKALEHSRSIYKEVDFRVMDAFDLKFEDNYFHMIIISRWGL